MNNNFLHILICFSLISKRGNHQYAISLLKKAIELAPDFAEAYSKLGSEYGDVGDAGEATQRLEIANEYHQYALKLQPKNADFLNNYGAFLFQSGRPTEAAEMYRRALRFNDHHEKARENLSQLINKQSTN